ncbi:MAG: hypothetical protein KDA66_20085, partial [Planctomycetaceae bacterium]|nr:hypothetical protein [Planctomycetaceae bacterium]
MELASGDMFTGRLLQWNDEHLEIDSVHFGVVHVKAESVRRIYRLTENPLLVYSGLTGVAGWNVHDTEWREDGPFLETSQDDAKISGDFQIPDKAMIEFELSWPQKPNFALVLGADPDLKEDKRQDGWRLEMWDQLLGVLREHKDIADVDRVAMILPSVKRVHLIAYLDQLEGSIQIFTADGSPAGKISVPPVEGTKPGRGIRIVNRHGTIRLERLRIARWNGQLPTSIPKGEIAYHLADGTTQLGIPQGFDADTREYMFKVGDDVKRSSEADVVMSERGPPEAVEARSMATMLQDGTRLSGQLERVEAASLVVQCPDISEALTIPQIGVRALVMSPTAAEKAAEEGSGRPGRLTIDGQNLAGWLIDGKKTDEAACFVWQPKTSRTSSAIKSRAAGEIVYREARKAVPVEQAQVRERPGANFLDIFLQKANTPPAERATTVDHNIHLRSGDIIPCNVLSI